MVDELDIKIMAELQKDGRQSNIDLARKLGVVEGTIRKRLKALQSKNVLRVIASPNPRKLGYNFISTMGIQVQMKLLRKVADALASKPNVCYLAFVTGRYDLMAVLMTRSSEELSDFIEKEITSIPGILRTETFLNLDVIKGEWQGMDTTQLVTELTIPPYKKNRE